VENVPEGYRAILIETRSKLRVTAAGQEIAKLVGRATAALTDGGRALRVVHHYAVTPPAAVRGAAPALPASLFARRPGNSAIP
jgi:hypothetical protein